MYETVQVILELNPDRKFVREFLRKFLIEF